MTDRIVRIEELEPLGLCARGVRRWFIDNGLDFKDFLKNGIPLSRLEGIDDALLHEALGRLGARDEH